LIIIPELIDQSITKLFFLFNSTLITIQRLSDEASSIKTLLLMLAIVVVVLVLGFNLLLVNFYWVTEMVVIQLVLQLVLLTLLL
jgi:hypothetical protein